jgi:hypothetical protein
VGNASSSSTIPIYLDNVKPLVDIDPGNVRTKNKAGGCSGSFDPVGGDTVSDLKPGLSRQEFLRALVWDRTNQVPNSPALLHFAGTDTASVKIYAHKPSDSSFLLVNTKNPGAGVCDEIGDFSQPTSLTSLTPSGTAWYTGEGAIAPATGASCTIPAAGTVPQTLCTSNFSKLWSVIGHYEGDLKEPAVYAYSPNVAGQECTGVASDFGASIDDDGFVCFAARATDKAENVGVSPPIRLCVDKNTSDGQLPLCASASLTPPTCTDGCTAPQRGGGMIVTLDPP